MNKKKFFIVTTIPLSLIFFKGQLSSLKEEFDVTLVSSPEKGLFETADLNQVNSIGVQMKREISVLSDIVSLVKLVFYFIKKKPDIVHGNTPKASFLSMTASWISRAPIRIYYVHGLRYQGTSGLKKELLVFMEKISCRFSTDIYAVSNGVKETMSVDGITKKAIKVIWNGSVNGINGSIFNPQLVENNQLIEKYNIKAEDFIFGFVGRIVTDKGINELVSAFKQVNSLYPNSKLILVGDFEDQLDPLKPEILDEIKGNTNIIHEYFQDDIRPYYKLMNVFVFPSYREGFGISLIEAASMGVPSISSNIIGCNEIIQNGVNGYLVPSKDELALFDKMVYCIENRVELEKISKSTRDIILSKFEQNELWKKTIESYKTLN